MAWTSTEILQAIWILVAIMIVVVLYHALFVVVDLRKVMRRVRNVTEQVESVIMTPLSMTEKAMQWVQHHLEKKTKHHEKKHPHHHEEKE